MILFSSDEKEPSLTRIFSAKFAFLGVRVTVFEKRTEFSRNNLLHIWHSTIRDLKNIGAKYFFPMFCCGGIK